MEIHEVDAKHFLQDDMCAQRILRSACTVNDQSLRCLRDRRSGSLVTQKVTCEDSEAQIDLSLRWAHIFVGNPVSRLNIMKNVLARLVLFFKRFKKGIFVHVL